MSNEEIKAYILKNFSYHNGVIKRRDRKGSNGSIDKYGYLILKVKGKQYKAHRIAWLLNYGDFPKSELDHINRDKLDNRIENLRESNRKEQNNNKEPKINSITGVAGVYYDTCTKGLKKRYTTKVDGKTHRFYTLQEAITYRKGARI